MLRREQGQVKSVFSSSDRSFGIVGAAFFAAFLASSAGAAAPAQPEPPEEAWLQAIQQRDAEAALRLRSAFSNIEDLRNVSVEVNGGVAKLTGEASSWTARSLAEDLARATPGIVHVHNAIVASREVETRLAPAIEQVRGYLEDAVAFSPLLALALLVLLFFALLAKFAGRSHRFFQSLSANLFVQSRLRQLLQTAVFLTGVLLALEILGVTAIVGALLGTAGIAGIVLGFAFKEIVENYLAGVLLSVRQPFSPSDHIRVGEHEGKVVRLTSRETLLMTLDGNHVRIPNSMVFNSVMTNYTRNPRRRLGFAVGIGVEQDLARVQRIGLEALGAVEGVIADPPPRFLIDALGDSNVSVRFLAWVDQRSADFAKVKSEAIRLVKLALDEAQVDMPEPIMQLKVRRMERPKKAPEPALAKVVEAVEQSADRDVSVDTSLDRQIEEDRRLFDEGDLLSGQSPGGGEAEKTKPNQ